MFVCRNRTSFFSGNEKGRARVVQFLWVLPTIMKTALFQIFLIISAKFSGLSFSLKIKDFFDSFTNSAAFLA